MSGTADTVRWRQPDGAPIGCREKLRVLDDNHAELLQVMRDAFDDAILMGVDEDAMRAVLADAVRSLRSPKRG
ncbi:hypothetical protein [Rhizosaccharibacter radicis]|uniref:Transcriptional regulator n=1 Tax=Rhizosaccharibacter radicis TaxID=2782605 RepID=A0ABT1W1G8_9PROT|nr:hypothetical protein [Acetobacteraceae bacterium KSS12]